MGVLMEISVGRMHLHVERKQNVIISAFLCVFYMHQHQSTHVHGGQRLAYYMHVNAQLHSLCGRDVLSRSVPARRL
jgi:hypothetical protein